ncbi:double-strand break repair helicase AddA [Rhizobiales bacterium]|uniref:double-strand break repair helicase AddA n=1 Tax=Hongsoonwoonella zoysiae TaxID=2821844 RepID=UPI00155FBB83|nr:double-strand break repair helicase AddA [Hongsoonwoonella zoysiae]NRG16469.1 double-strand break repair helicase AddA [Hongsoonwoonella zoysiae]
MSRPEIPASTLEKQSRAADPARSAWVSANAGSGKTFVLARRVVRLLLSGTDPSRLLCLTFTKAAAAEMATRVFETLGSWTNMDDARLAEELTDIEGMRPDARRLARARHLFAKALETPGGLKIQTIHAFCEALLHQFPLEANIAGHFTVLDDRVAAELLAEARARVLFRAENDPDSDLGKSLSFLINELSDKGVGDVLDEMVSKRDHLRRWLTDFPGLDAAVYDLARRLGVDPAASLESIENNLENPDLLSKIPLWNLVGIFEAGGANDRKMAETLKFCAEAEPGPRRRAAWLSLFLTQKMEPRKKLASKAIGEDYPHVLEAMEREQLRLLDLLDERRKLVTIRGTEAILKVSDAMLGAYEKEKTRRGFLDFEDLVVRTANLLSREDAALWVQYKLDQGLDHILVDEAQDTSPRQWEVIDALAGEFFAGKGARDVTRTIFAVGDEKQSIYSFQGAVPAYFAKMRRGFGRRAEQADVTFDAIDLTLSFRSTPDVLGAVDVVFADVSARKGLSQDGEAPVHEAVRRNDPGLVEIWPLEQAEDVEESDDWTQPIDRVSTGSPMMRVARRIAQTIDNWRKNGEADPGDVLVLVRKRGPFVEALTRELKRRDVPVAGSDRLILTDHIAVKDLVALGRFLLLPEDDLSLANILKSPLFNLSDDDLFRIARDEPGRPRAGTLWQSLVKKADADPYFAEVRKKLEDWRSRADFVPPFEFFSRLLGADGGRKAYRARFGTEIDDIIDEFLALTIVFEQTGTPGLEGFLAWLAAAPTEIKRELASAAGVVRIMTVHGAKGLEAPAVILVDPGAAPVSAHHDPAMLEFPRGDNDFAAPGLLWLSAKSDRTSWHEEAVAELRAKSEEEYRRLLYVAMTRARDRLVVCGWAGKSAPPEGTWYGLVRTALEPQALEEKDGEGGLSRLLWRKGGMNLEAPKLGGEPSAAAPSEIAPPDWLTRPANVPARPRRLQPSKAFDEMEAKEGYEQPDGLAALEAARSSASWALKRGNLMHRMLETLPEMEAAARRGAAERYLDHALSPDEVPRKKELAEEALNVLNDARFATVFSPQARAEVPIVGRIAAPDGEEILVSGQVDRLLVAEDEVLIVDYKTNRHAPQAAEDAPLEYVTQLAVYRRLLGGIYPGRTIRAALLWTAAPRLMEVSAELMDKAYAELR